MEIIIKISNILDKRHMFGKLQKITLILLLCTGFFLSGQEDPENIMESVNVTNIEVPVRVFFQGEMIDKLTRKDFKIYEGSVQRQINGFYIERKKMKSPDRKPDLNIRKKVLAPRYFVLVLHINEMNDHLKQGIGYIFDNILQETDQLMVIAAGKTLFFANLNKKEETKIQVMGVLKSQCREAGKRMRSLIAKVRGIPVIGTEEDERADNYLKFYLKIMLDYRKKYLQPEMELLYNFARYLETIKIKKWVINLYQEEIVPHLSRVTKNWINNLIEELMSNPGSQHWAQNAKIIQRKLYRLESELNAATNFPVEVLQSFFVKTGATFHTLLIPTTGKPEVQFYNGEHNLGFEYKRISTDFENVIREITRKTGGTLIYSKNLKSSLKTIEEKEDICYWLTFAPGNPEKVGKVRIEVKDRRYKPVYDKRVTGYYLEQFMKKQENLLGGFRLEKVNISNKLLHILINLKHTAEKTNIQVDEFTLRIRIKDSLNRYLFDEKKIVKPIKEMVRISVPFPQLDSGKYYVMVDIRDLRTGKTDFRFLETSF